MKTIFAIFLFNLKSLVRNFKSTGIMFILPIVFMGIFGLAFGKQTNMVEFSLGVYQNTPTAAANQPDSDLSKALMDVTKDNKNLKIEIKKYDNLDTLKNDVKLKNVDIGLNFSQMNARQTFGFEIIQYSNDLSSNTNHSVLSEVLAGLLFGSQSPITTLVLNEANASLTGFDLLAPGLIIYGLIILIPGIAQNFTEIREKNYLFRYAMSKIKAYQIILGNVLFYTFVGIIQIVILYGTARLLGYHSTGNLLFAFVPAILSLFFVIGLGLIIGSFFQKTSAATNIGTMLNIILGFFSGSFIAGIGKIWEFQLFGKVFQFNDFLPTKWATQAMEKILTNNLGLQDIKTELIILFCSGVLTLLVSVLIYSNKQLKVQG